MRGGFAVTTMDESVPFPDGPDIDGSFVPVLRPSVAIVELDGEGVLLDGHSGSLHVLNPVATIVTHCFDGSGSVDELVVDLSDVFRADIDQVRRDVLSLVRQ